MRDQYVNIDFEIVWDGSFQKDWIENDLCDCLDFLIARSQHWWKILLGIS